MMPTGLHPVIHEPERTTPGFEGQGSAGRQHWMQALFQLWSPLLIPLDMTMKRLSNRKG